MVTRPDYSYHDKREEKLGNWKTWEEKSKEELLFTLNCYIEIVYIEKYLCGH